MMKIDNQYKYTSCPMGECQHCKNNYCQLDFIELEYDSIGYRCISIKRKI